VSGKSIPRLSHIAHGEMHELSSEDVDSWQEDCDSGDSFHREPSSREPPVSLGALHMFAL